MERPIPSSSSSFPSRLLGSGTKPPSRKAFNTGWLIASFARNLILALSGDRPQHDASTAMAFYDRRYCFQCFHPQI